MRFLRSKRERLYERAPPGALRQCLGTPWPEPSTHVDQIALVALDLETTGLDPRKDQIVSFGWVELRHGRIDLSSARHEVVQSKGALSASSVIVHGISDDRVASGVALRDVLDELMGVIAGAALIAHHAQLDAAFLDSACQRVYGARWAGPCIDTLRLLERTMQRRQQPITPDSLRLAVARRGFGLPSYPQHDALWDAIAAAELWLAIGADLRGSGGLKLSRVQQILP